MSLFQVISLQQGQSSNSVLLGLLKKIRKIRNTKKLYQIKSFFSNSFPIFIYHRDINSLFICLALAEKTPFPDVRLERMVTDNWLGLNIFYLNPFYNLSYLSTGIIRVKLVLPLCQSLFNVCFPTTCLNFTISLCCKCYHYYYFFLFLDEKN